jgi:DNA-binding PadR family transcriptional regulator
MNGIRDEHMTAPNEFLPLPNLHFHILLALSDGASHGYAIIKRIGEMTEGESDPSTGSLYMSMMRLEDQGLIETADGPADASARRRYYKLTRLGRETARAEAARLSRLMKYARAADLLTERR